MHIYICVGKHVFTLIYSIGSSWCFLIESGRYQPKGKSWKYVGLLNMLGHGSSSCCAAERRFRAVLAMWLWMWVCCTDCYRLHLCKARRWNMLLHTFFAILLLLGRASAQAWPMGAAARGRRLQNVDRCVSRKVSVFCFHCAWAKVFPKMSRVVKRKLCVYTQLGFVLFFVALVVTL